MAKLLDSATGTTAGAEIVFPATENFSYSVLHIAGKTDIDDFVDVIIKDGATIIYQAPFYKAFDIPIDKKFFSTMGNSLTCRIDDSTASCEIYASVERKYGVSDGN